MVEKKDLVQSIVQTIDDKRGKHPIVLNMTGVSLLADFFIICHGHSEKQVQAIASAVKEVAIKQGIEMKRMEGFAEARWVLLDLGDIIVHVFHKDDRKYYNLERLWGDAQHYEIGETHIQ